MPIHSKDIQPFLGPVEEATANPGEKRELGPRCSAMKHGKQCGFEENHSGPHIVVVEFDD